MTPQLPVSARRSGFRRLEFKTAYLPVAEGGRLDFCGYLDLFA